MPTSEPAPDATIDLEVPARPEYLSLIRLVVGAAAGVGDLLGPDRIDDLKLVVSEACTNAIEAYPPDAAEPLVRVRCEVGDDGVMVEVADLGKGFDPERAGGSLMIDDPGRAALEGGLGLPLMGSLCDELSIRSGDAGTTVRLVIREDR